MAPKPGSNVELTLSPISTASLRAARKAVRRRRNTPELLKRVAELYRKAGGGAEGIDAVAEELVYDPRHVRRLRSQAVELGLLEEGE